MLRLGGPAEAVVVISSFLPCRRDQLLDVADLGDAEAEVFPDFDSFADADGLVVDQQLGLFLVAAWRTR